LLIPSLIAWLPEPKLEVAVAASPPGTGKTTGVKDAALSMPAVYALFPVSKALLQSYLDYCKSDLKSVTGALTPHVIGVTCMPAAYGAVLAMLRKVVEAISACSSIILASRLRVFHCVACGLQVCTASRVPTTPCMR
jgi:hypothetical protein